MTKTNGDAAAKAYRDLAATLTEMDAKFISPERGMHSPEERQTQCDRDGSFRMVVAHRDPGVPNWIDAGVPTGMIFWRFLLPEEPVPAIEAEVVDVASLR